jgi:hypothetical protein
MDGAKETVEALSRFVETILLCCEHSPNHLYPYPLFARPNFDIRLCSLPTVYELTMPKALHILPMESMSSATQDNLLAPPGDFTIAITPGMNMEPRKFHHLPTAEQFLETMFDPQSPSPIHPCL